MGKNNNQNNKNNKQKEFEEILAKESPELLLKLKKYETEPRLPSSFSEPVKLIIVIGIIDVIVAFLLTIISKKSHFIILGSTGLWVAIPWWLAFLDGFIFLGYGIYVIKRKEGELDISFTRGNRFKVHKIKGDAASVLGLIYISLGILLIGVVVIRSFIRGIF